MAVLPILTWPDARLSEVCTAMEQIDPAFVADLFETMYAALGRGLAAPQVGLMLRVFVMDTGWKTGDMTPLACINPEIISRSEQTALGVEACLSIPGVEAEVPRAQEIVLRYTDLNGATQDRPLSGAEAICAQHELDHLDGKVIFDRLPGAEAAALQARYA